MYKLHTQLAVKFCVPGVVKQSFHVLLMAVIQNYCYCEMSTGLELFNGQYHIRMSYRIIIEYYFLREVDVVVEMTMRRIGSVEDIPPLVEVETGVHHLTRE